MVITWMGSPIADQYVDGVPIDAVLYGWLK